MVVAVAAVTVGITELFTPSRCRRRADCGVFVEQRDQETNKRSKPIRKGGSVRVGRARVGRGVFAQKRFRISELIGEICGDIIDDPNYGSSYCFSLENGSQLEPTAPFRYVNHSCEPNCSNRRTRNSDHQ